MFSSALQFSSSSFASLLGALAFSEYSTPSAGSARLLASTDASSSFLIITSGLIAFRDMCFDRFETENGYG